MTIKSPLHYLIELPYDHDHDGPVYHGSDIVIFKKYLKFFKVGDCRKLGSKSFQSFKEAG
jgi:hypothetical protein